MPSLLLNFLLLAMIVIGHLWLMRAVAQLSLSAMLGNAAWLTLITLLGITTIVVGVGLVEQLRLHALAFLLGAWSARIAGWGIYANVCLISFIVNCAGLIVGGRRQPRGERRRIEDLTARLDLKGRAAAKRHKLLVWAAGKGINEIYRVEFAEQCVPVSRLPEAWEGLSILHLSDLHYSGIPGRAFFEQVYGHLAEMLPATPSLGSGFDLIALTGDILDDLQFSDWLGTLGNLRDSLRPRLGCYFVLGNHDLRTHPAKTRAVLTGMGWIDVGGRFVTREFLGRQLLIAGNERPWWRELPDLSAAPPDAFRLLLSHSPHQFGWGRRNRFDLTLAGHLHGGQIRFPIIGAPIVGRYGTGIFVRRPSALHVSRGLGEMLPLRVGCRPEVTKLILQKRARRGA